MFLSTEVQFSLLVGVLLIHRVAGQVGGSPCHIPPGQSSLAAANTDALRFTFSTIKNNVNYILPNLRTAEHVYTVNSCQLVIYLLSESLPDPVNPFLQSADIQGTGFSCADPTSSSKNGDMHGTVIKFLTKWTFKPEVIPESWNSGNNIVLQLYVFRGFPDNPTTSYRCRLERNITVIASVIQVIVTSNLTVQKVGCPKTHWGTGCKSPCFCQNGGECDTFQGSCVCREGTYGILCEKVRPSTTSDSFVNTTVSPDGKMGTSPQTTEAQETTRSQQTTQTQRTTSAKVGGQQGTSGVLATAGKPTPAVFLFSLVLLLTMV